MNKFKSFMVALLMLSAANAYGQEKIIEVQNFRDKSSLIRETKDSLWLVCNNADGLSYFSLIDEYATTTPQLRINYIPNRDSLHIYDFEIFLDTVYFCGTTWTDGSSKGIWGYFPLAGFPNVSIQYSEVENNGFSKLDVFSADPYNIVLHVVMTSFMPRIGPTYAYDEVRVAPNTFYESFSTIDTMMCFHDVVVTDNNIVFAKGIWNGEVIYIDKPTGPGTTIFVEPTVRYPITIPKTSSVILEYCEGDAVVAAMGGLLYDIELYSFISAYSSHSHLTILNTQGKRVQDMKYDKYTRDLELLTTSPTFLGGCAHTSTIYHLNPSLAGYGGSIFCHEYSQNLCSLDLNSKRKRNFVACGHECGPDILRLYTYQYDAWGNCVDRKIVKSNGENWKVEPIDVFPDNDGYEITMKKLDPSAIESQLKIICD